MTSLTLRSTLIPLMFLSWHLHTALGHQGAHHHHHHHDSHSGLRGLQAPVPPCSTTAPAQEDLTLIEDTLQKFKGTPINTEQLINFNVYWHSIRTDTGLRGITPTMIANSVILLNNAFFSAGFSFNLVNTDYTDSNAFFYADDGSTAETNMKNQLHIGDQTDLNIYSNGISDISGSLGYAEYPWNYASNPTQDGVVIDTSATVGGTSPGYEQGDILVHLVGHWLGLFHVFEGNSCTGTGDFVDDTPPQSIASSGCPTGQDSCPGGGLDSINNYMDFTNNACMTQFTSGQISRMQAAYQAYRYVPTPGFPTPAPAPAPTPPPVVTGAPTASANDEDCVLIVILDSIFNRMSNVACSALSVGC